MQRIMQDMRLLEATVARTSKEGVNSIRMQRELISFEGFMLSISVFYPI